MVEEPIVVQLTIVVPMYHTAPSLPELHRRISSAVPHGVDVEFVYVDDDCDQGSGDAVEQLGRADPRVHLVRHETNRGQHHAIRTGLGTSKGEIVVVLDGDLQDPPEAIPKLVQLLAESEVDAVFAGKYGRYQGPLRIASGRSFKWLMHRFGGVPIDAGGYVAMTRNLVDEILAQDYASPYLLLGIAVTKRPTISIPVQRNRRLTGRSATSSLTRMRLGLGVLRTLWKERH